MLGRENPDRVRRLKRQGRRAAPNPAVEAGGPGERRPSHSCLSRDPPTSRANAALRHATDGLAGRLSVHVLRMNLDDVATSVVLGEERHLGGSRNGPASTSRR